MFNCKSGERLLGVHNCRESHAVCRLLNICINKPETVIEFKSITSFIRLSTRDSLIGEEINLYAIVALILLRIPLTLINIIVNIINKQICQYVLEVFQ